MKNPLDALRRLFPRRTRGEDAPLRAFKEFEASVNLIEDYEHVAGNFLGKIREVCPGSKLVLLTFDADAGRFTCASSAGVPDADAAAATFPRNSRLVKWLKVNETHLDLSLRSGVIDFLTERERELLAGLGVRIAFPLISMNRLVGILLVGAGPDRPPFTKLEIAFITALLPQAGIALENALLFREQRERLRRMSRADKLATVGELAAGAAHEIRNPLTSIRSSLQYLASKTQDETAGRLLGTALQETERIDGIVSALLSFSRPSEIVKERLDLRDVLGESLELVSFQARTGKVAVEPALGNEALAVRGDRAQLKQLFLNIFLNAIQAMPDGGRLSIEALAKEGRKAVITVSDTGAGIPEEDLDRIFDPFFTTKKGGTGLGLSICYSIVKAHQGEIEARSKPGQGTAMRVSLPLA